MVLPNKAVTASSGNLAFIDKVINTAKAKMADILKNEINTMIYTIGAGVGQISPLKMPTMTKIIIMTDADTDGAHIRPCSRHFYRYMRPLVEAGHVYIALPPLYKMSKERQEEEVAYAWTDGG